MAVDPKVAHYLDSGIFGTKPIENIVRSETDDKLSQDEKDILERLIGGAKMSDEEARKYFDENVAPQLDKLSGAADTAAATNAEATRQLGVAGDKVQGVYNKAAEDTANNANAINRYSADALDKYSGQMDNLSASDRDALQKYLGETDPLMGQLKAGGWGDDVKGDAEGVDAQRKALGLALTDAEQGAADQRDVMNRYRELSSPEAGAQERYIAEMARRNFEGQDRGNREAVMQNLSQRGLNSGTLQIANNLAAQERLGQERTQAELGLQANAVNRGMQGLAGYGEAAGLLRGQNQSANALYGNQAGDIRTANDAINTFNKTGSQVAQQYQNTYAQNEAGRVGNLAGERNTTAQQTNKTAGDRATGVQQESQDMLSGNYGRTQDVVGANTRAGDVGYDTETAYAGAVKEGGQQGFENQSGVTGATTGAAAVKAGAPKDEEDALKLALGQVSSDRAVNAAV